ncbi:MAG: hypothetical protein ABI867_03745 [Kofleriaceae bacterium]
MARAFDELAAFGVGIQLTPGNLPTVGFADHVARSQVTTRRHHGFSFDARKQAVWSAAGTCLVASESVHPPQDGECAVWSTAAQPILEVMYPGYALGTGDAVERAMAARVPLAVDISHVHIQRTQGVMTDRVWRQLAAYDRIEEVHASANAGRHDTHDVMREATFGLAWARERLVAGTPVIVECYMHRLSAGEREGQLELLRS